MMDLMETRRSPLEWLASTLGRQGYTQRTVQGYKVLEQGGRFVAVWHADEGRIDMLPRTHNTTVISGQLDDKLEVKLHAIKQMDGLLSILQVAVPFSAAIAAALPPVQQVIQPQIFAVYDALQPYAAGPAKGLLAFGTITALFINPILPAWAMYKAIRQLYDRLMNRLADGYGYRLGQDAISELPAPAKIET